MRPLLPALLFLLPLPALAQTALTAEEFEAATTGRTLTYAQDGQVYGVEQYLSGRRVVWAFRADECRWGSWYQAGEQICFVYTYDPVPQCWIFRQAGAGSRMTAQFMGPDAGSPLSVVAETQEPLACIGPDVGA